MDTLEGIHAWKGVGSKNFNSLVCEEDCVEGAVLARYVVLCNSILLLQDNYRHSGFSITMYQCQWEHLCVCFGAFITCWGNSGESQFCFAIISCVSCVSLKLVKRMEETIGPVCNVDDFNVWLRMHACAHAFFLHGDFLGDGVDA